MDKCLVLGANGFIGSHLVDSLVQKGCKVRAFDRFKDSKVTFNESKSIELFSGDFLNRSDLQQAIKGMDYVFHFISTTTPISAENDPLIDVDTNIRMSIELLKLCTENKIKRIIYASTGGAIYGENVTDKPKLESDLPLPVSPYAIGKLTIEHYLRDFRVRHGLDSKVFRISNPYGERQPLYRKQGVIPIFIENICQSKPIIVFGDGSMVRDYVYVKDVANIITQTYNKNCAHNTYNLGFGEGVTLNNLVTIISEVSKIKPIIITKPKPPTFVDKVVLDISRLESDFNIKPITPLSVGIEKTYNYISKIL